MAKQLPQQLPARAFTLVQDSIRARCGSRGVGIVQNRRLGAGGDQEEESCDKRQSCWRHLGGAGGAGWSDGGGERACKDWERRGGW